MYLHHLVGIGAMVACLIAGYGMVGLNSFGLLTEISTIFLNYRSILHVHEYNNFWPTVNALIFFLTFTVFRMMLIPYLLTLLYKDLLLSWNYVDNIRKTCIIIGCTLFSFTITLNIYWYYKILISLAKLFGCISVRKKD